MFAEINVQLLEPNVLYLDEKPPKIVKSKGAPKKGVRSKKVATKHDIITQKKGKEKKILKKSKSKQRENNKSKANEVRHEIIDAAALGDDPLYTTEKEIKMEIDLEYKNEGEGGNDSFEQEIPGVDDNEQDKDDFSADNDETGEYEVKLEEEEEQDDGDISNSDEDSEEDEPLIMLTRRKGRPRKYALKIEDRIKMPRMEQCREICKQQCTQKFSEENRRSMCDSFWSLSEEDKVQFIRKHTKTKRYTRLKRKTNKSRGNNCCYYLDDDSILIRVCRKYFESTLCITNYTIKKALEGYEPEVEMKPLMDHEKECGKKSKEYLDPETGNLITIDPIADKIKKSSETAPKKRRIRRKPEDPLPEHNPKPIKCAQRCIYKCHTKFTEEERKQISDIFWSMDYKRRKDFILARIETKDVETQITPEFRKSNRPPRTYHTRFFLRSGIHGENKRICKDFMMATLSINRKFIRNAIDFADKTTGYYTGVDRRGQNSGQNKIGLDCKKAITDHIRSYPTWVPNKKSKTRYLHHTLNIKRMYAEYKEMCVAEQKKFMSIHGYYKSFHDDFRLSFLSNPEPKRGGGFMKLNPNVSHYNGDEPGGMWLDPSGERLDRSRYNPAESFISFNRSVAADPDASSAIVTATTLTDDPTTSAVQQSMPQTSSFSFNQSLSYAHLIDPSLSSSIICQPSAVRHEFNLNFYDSNLPPAHAASTSSMLRRL